MKKMGIVMLAMLVASMFGCKSVDSERNPFDIMQEKANAITAAGGLAAVGTASSRNVSLALTKAKTRGRDELASIIEAKVNSLKKDFQEEIGEGKAAEFNSLFSNASKVIVSETLRGSVPKDLKYDTKNGQTEAWALMVLDPKVISDAFEGGANTKRHLYTRFRASQAFSELDEEVKKFEEFKKKDMGGM
jgi:hypothetical protein